MCVWGGRVLLVRRARCRLGSAMPLDSIAGGWLPRCPRARLRVEKVEARTSGGRRRVDGGGPGRHRVGVFHIHGSECVGHRWKLHLPAQVRALVRLEESAVCARVAAPVRGALRCQCWRASLPGAFSQCTEGVDSGHVHGGRGGSWGMRRGMRGGGMHTLRSSPCRSFPVRTRVHRLIKSGGLCSNHPPLVCHI